jgi:adenine-specific DNA glycosylase
MRIAAADDATLMAIAEQGGMRPAERVERWRTIARIVNDDCAGDLGVALAALPPARARALLKRFPSIGDPGADKVLLFSGADVRPALDSNGLRALARLGIVEEGPSYSASYKAAVAALSGHGRPDRAWLMDAYALLREHGKTLCRRSAPQCLPCPLDAVCAHIAAAHL